MVYWVFVFIENTALIWIDVFFTVVYYLYRKKILDYVIKLATDWKDSSNTAWLESQIKKK